MMGKVLVLLWTSATLVTSVTVDESNKTLTNVPASYASNITKLRLAYNLIVMNSSDTQALSHYPNLTELDLSYNHIAQLSGEAFPSLSSLHLLILKGNNLQAVRNESFAGLGKLRRLDLGKNPWNCSCLFVSFMKWMNNSGVRTEGPDAVCATPKNMAGKSILDVANACSFKKPALPVTSDPVTSTTAVITPTSTAFTRGQRTTYVESNTAANHNISNKDFLAAGSRNGQQEPVVSNTWKFLAGVVLIALCTSMFIICAIKSPSWYKLLFDYRHQRLHELDEPSNTGRYFNFSLDTEQTETSAQELDQDPKALSPEDEDGFIEDGYIQAENYKDHDDIDEI